MTLNDKNVLNLIGDRCRNKRNALGLPLKEIAIDLDCTLQNISDFERGRNNSATILYYYITRLGVTL